MSNFLQNFYDILINPDKAFDSLKEETPLLQSFLIVLFINILNPIINFEISKPIFIIFGLTFNIVNSAVCGIVNWFLISAFIGLMAWTFKQECKTKQLLTLSAFSLLPWIFIAPISLFKLGGIVGAVLYVILHLAIWIWTTILFIYAIMKSYNFPVEKAIMVSLIPLFGAIISFSWIGSLFSTIINLFKI